MLTLTAAAFVGSRENSCCFYLRRVNMMLAKIDLHVEVVVLALMMLSHSLSLTLTL